MKNIKEPTLREEIQKFLNRKLETNDDLLILVEEIGKYFLDSHDQCGPGCGQFKRACANLAALHPRIK